MSSLRTIIRKGKMFVDDIIRDDPKLFEWYSGMVRGSMRELLRPQTILVNIQSVYLDMGWPIPDQEKLADIEGIQIPKEKLRLDSDQILKIVGWYANPSDSPPRPMPPFETMWLEYMAEENGQTQKHGFLVKRAIFNDSFTHRHPDIREHFRKSPDIQTIVDVLFWTHDREDFAWLIGTGAYALTKDGDFITSARTLIKCEEEFRVEWRKQLQFRQGVLLHSMSRMNCRNVELRQIPNGKVHPHASRKVTPASVWHEIVITSTPNIRTTGHDAFPVDDSQKRAYWIRGHYADYRKGAGLFGNPKLKAMFWIPEYRRGNEQLGQVIPEYKLQ